MEDKDIELILFEYFSGKLDYEQVLEIERWISESPENKDFAAQVCKNIQSVNLCEESLRHDSDEINALASGNTARPARPSLWKYASVAAVAAVLVAGVMLFFGKNTMSEKLVEISSGSGAVYSAVLPDNTKVWLNSNSTLRYPAKFKGDTRQTYLEGEAYFEVTKNPDKPFLVNAGNAVVKVLGTSFDVEAYPGSGHLIKTTLHTGSVKMIFKEGAEECSAVLTPGQRIIINPLTGRSSISSADPESVSSWKSGYLCFNGNSVADVLSMIGNFYNVDFVIDGSKDLGNDTFSGSFKDQSLEEILKIVGNVCSVDFKQATSEEGTPRKYIVF